MSATASTGKLNLRQSHFGEGSVEVSPPKDGEGGVRRLAICKDGLLTEPAPGVKVVPDVLDYAAEKYPDVRAVAWREVVQVHKEEKKVKKVVDGEEREESKTWSYFELSEPKFMTFKEYRLATREVGRALAHLGFGKSDDVVNIYAATGINWQLMAHGCQVVSTCIATSYETLGPEGLTHSVNEPNCRAIFTNANLMATVVKILPNTPSVEFVFYDGDLDQSMVDKIKSIRDGAIRTMHIDEIRKLGKEQEESILESLRPVPTLPCAIAYTSGSTGTPKGVHITHSNLIASIAGVNTLYGHHIPVGTVYMAYLPLAHILEYIVELCAVFTGATAVYGSPKTLTDSSVRNCKGDLSTYQPTVLFGVPGVWETIRKGVVGELDKKGWLLQKVVYASLELKKRNIPILGSVADNLILSKLRVPTGGNVKWGINGGAAISHKTQEFLSVTMMPLMQAYGMTESCGMCAILPPELHQYGVAGLPVPSVEIKLLDVPDMDYTSKKNPPQGEVCVRGPSLMKGYYKRPDLNEDPNIFTADGWFRTGDIGQWNADGTLSVIDRLKNLIKLQSGEYIALEKLEAVYKSTDMISNLCIYASQDADQPIGIVVPHEKNLRHALQSNGKASLADKSNEDLCSDEEVKKFILKACNDLARQNKFKQAEMFVTIIISAEEWTPESGLLTAAQKVNRGAVSKKFKEEIKVAYGNN